MKNHATAGWLVCDTSDRIVSSDEAYAVTTTTGAGGATARSIFVLERANDKDGAPDNCVHFGQQVRLVTSAQIGTKPLYLSSTQVSPTAFARFSRNQEVFISSIKNYNATWIVLPAQGCPKAACGQVVSGD